MSLVVAGKSARVRLACERSFPSKLWDRKSLPARFFGPNIPSESNIPTARAYPRRPKRHSDRNSRAWFTAIRSYCPPYIRSASSTP